VVCPQPDFQRRLHAVLTELAVEQPCTLTEYPRSGTLAALVARHACNICFLDAATNSEDAQLLISELARRCPWWRCTAQRRGPDPALPAPRRLRVRRGPHGRRAARRL